MSKTPEELKRFKEKVIALLLKEYDKITKEIRELELELEMEKQEKVVREIQSYKK